MKRVKKILKLAAQATVAVAVITSLSSCTLERPVGRSKVDIVVPDLSGASALGRLAKLDRLDSRSEHSHRRQNRQTLSADSPSSDSVFLPIYELTQVSDFTCLGLHISGSDIESENSLIPEPAQCGGEELPSMHTPGRLLGLLPVTGGSLAVDLPTGSVVDVQLFGMVTSDGTCPSVSQLMGNLETLVSASHGDAEALEEIGSPEFQWSDQPFELASSRVTLNQDQELLLDPSFSADELKPVFCDGSETLAPQLALSAAFVAGQFVELSGLSSNLSLLSADSPIEVWIELSIPQHPIGFDPSSDITLTGASFTSAPERRGPGDYWITLEISDLANFEAFIPAGSFQDPYGRFNDASSTSIGDSIRQALEDANFPGAGGEIGSGGAGSPLSVSVSLFNEVDRNISVEDSNSNGTFDRRSDTSGSIRFIVTFSKSLSSSPTVTELNPVCTFCSVNSVSEVSGSNLTQFEITIEGTGFSQSALMSLQIPGGSLSTATGGSAPEFFSTSNTESIHATVTNPVSGPILPTLSFSAGNPTTITSGTSLPAMGLCSNYGLPIKIELQDAYGSPMGTRITTCSTTGSWSDGVTFEGPTVSASGMIYQFAIYPAATLDSSGSALSWATATTSSTAFYNPNPPAILSATPGDGQVWSIAGALLETSRSPSPAINKEPFNGRFQEAQAEAKDAMKLHREFLAQPWTCQAAEFSRKASLQSASLCQAGRRLPSQLTEFSTTAHLLS